MTQVTFNSADEAEAAFYAAFEAGDADAMMAVWADDDIGVECVHPMSTRLVSRDEVESSWRGIFSNGSSLKFEISEVRRMEAGELSVHIVHENIRYGAASGQRSRVIATNVYRKTEHGWFMVLHHGSPGAISPEPAAPEGPLH